MFATTTSSTARGLNIDGNVSDQDDASAGTNGTSWETNEDLSGNSATWYISWDNTNLYIGRVGGNNGEPQIIYVQADYSGASYTNTPTSYDNFTPSFSGLSGTAGINFAAYLKSDYDEYRTWGGSSWSGANTSLSPQYQTVSLAANLEVTIAWSKITASNGTPDNFRVVFYQTNGNSGSIFAYGESPSGNPDGSTGTPTISNWWGGYAVTSGISPDGTSDASLPVELTSFTASLLKGTVQLNWVTESEIDNLGFLLDRSLEPLSGFETIADYRFDSELQGQGSVTYRTDYSYTDREVVPGTKYYYVLSDVTGNPEHGEPVTRHTDKMVNATPLWAESETGILKDFRLLKVYPNPFNPVASISYATDVDGNVQMDIIDMNGNVVKSLIKGYHSAGSYELDWIPNELSAGVYFCQMISAEHQVTRKIIYLK